MVRTNRTRCKFKINGTQTRIQHSAEHERCIPCEFVWVSHHHYRLCTALAIASRPPRHNSDRTNCELQPAASVSVATSHAWPFDWDLRPKTSAGADFWASVEVWVGQRESAMERGGQRGGVVRPRGGETCLHLSKPTEKRNPCKRC